MASLAGSPPKIAGRLGGHYLSEDMTKIKEWCEENKLEWSFNYFDEAGVPFLEENMLGVIGELTQEIMDTFPIKYNNVEVLK